MVAFFEVMCGICMLLGLLGELQAIPAISLVTGAVIRSCRELFGVAFMMACIMPLVGMLLYILVLSDERLTRITDLASYAVFSTVTGTPPLASLASTTCYLHLCFSDSKLAMPTCCMLQTNMFVLQHAQFDNAGDELVGCRRLLFFRARDGTGAV